MESVSSLVASGAIHRMQALTIANDTPPKNPHHQYALTPEMISSPELKIFVAKMGSRPSAHRTKKANLSKLVKKPKI